MIYNVVLTDGTRIKRGDKEWVPPFAGRTFYENKVKYMPLADMRLKGMTLAEIGRKKGVTRERIRQILNIYFPDIVFPHARTFLKERRPLMKLVCLQCKKEQMVPDYAVNLQRKFCDRVCQLAWYKARRRTPEEQKERERQRGMKFYNKHKDEPKYMALRKEYNRRQQVRYRKKKRQEIYERSIPD